MWIQISLKFVPKGSINNIPALVQIMAWHRPGDKLLSEPVMVNLPTHICVTRPQWVNGCVCLCFIFFSCYLIVAATNGCYFADDIFNRIFVKENLCLWIQISLKFVAEDLIDKLSALVEVMAWCWPWDKPLPEAMMTQFANTCIYVQNSMSYKAYVWGPFHPRFSNIIPVSPTISFTLIQILVTWAFRNFVHNSIALLS